MNLNDFEWKQEIEWLEYVLEEARKQYNEKRDTNERAKREAIETQKELWEELGSVSISNELDQIADFMGFISMLKRQKRTHVFTKKIKEKYEKMILSPYFGRFDFNEDGDERPEKCYIGISNLVNDDYDILIYDWRAPISSMFYDYETGEAGYKCSEGTIKGKITLKRQYKISNSKIEYMFDSNLKIDDEILQEILSKSTDTKMKTIVTTIQREQNRVIRNEEYKNLIVQGPAGSGKTSIALHRVAYLLYKHREEITPENIVVFSPNQIFNDYISNVLPQLGEDNMLQTTFNEYMHKALDVDFKKESNYEMMEYILSSRDNPTYQKRIRNIRYKSSAEFLSVLKKYISYVEKKDRNFTDIIFRGNLIISSRDLQELYYKDYSNLPLKRRLQKIRERILFLLKPYEKERIGEIAGELEKSGYYLDNVEIMEKSIGTAREETKDIYSEINRITEFDLVGIYENLIERLEVFCEDSYSETNEKKIDEIKDYTLENLRAGQIYYEDQSPLLYLKGALGDLPKTSDIKYVIIDEAQDYTPLQYEIFYQLFNHASITMLGDLNQSINPFMNVGDYNNISHVFPQDNTCIINLTKSYRSTIEITNFSRILINKEINDESVERHGDEPLVLNFQDEEAIRIRILEDIKTYKDKGYNSIGIITRTKKEANEVYSYLKDKVQAKLIVNDDDEYTNGTVIIPAYLAKGLEFDAVLIYNAGNENYCSEDERLLFYTACTRALHMLCVYYSGKLTPLLRGAAL